MQLTPRQVSDLFAALSSDAEGREVLRLMQVNPNAAAPRLRVWLQRRNSSSITTNISGSAVNKLVTIGYAESVYLTQPQATRRPSGRDLRGANLEGKDLRKAVLVGADLTGANLRSANLDDAVLVNATIIGANLYAVRALRANFLGADLTGANLEFGYFYQASFRRAVLRDTRLRMSQMFQVDATGADFRDAMGVPSVRSGMKVGAARLTAELRKALNIRA